MVNKKLLLSANDFATIYSQTTEIPNNYAEAVFSEN